MTETHYDIKGCPVSVAFLADTHDTDPEPILSSLRAHSPSLIVHTGDLVHGKLARPGATMRKSQNAVNLLRGCAALAPTFVSLGNHEAYLYQDDLDIIRSTGVQLLDNTFVTLHAGGNKLVIGGLTSGYYTAYHQYGATEKTVKKPKPVTEWLESFAAADGYHILLMHHPEYIRFVPPSVGLILSGHAHGGQWRFYDLRARQWRGLYAPDQGLFPKLTGGIVDGRQIISRGLSNPIGIPRLHNETELIYLRASNGIPAHMR